MPEQPTYIVYAGSYGRTPVALASARALGQAPVPWICHGWQPCGADAAAALAWLLRYQQAGYDFCGILVTDAA